MSFSEDNYSCPWQITFSNPFWLGENVVLYATSDELSLMTCESYSFRCFLEQEGGGFVAGALESLYEQWEDFYGVPYSGSCDGGPCHNPDHLTKDSLKQEMIQGLERAIQS